MQSQDPCENCPLLLPSLRLFIPPLRLVSAAMWQVVQRGDVQDYGMLEEFVTMVTEIVPELWSCSQRAQLLLGLRARLVLELCRTEQTLDLTNIQKHLDRIRSLTSTGEAESNDAEVELSESNFVELVESLLKDPSERENFYQDVFPVEFGPKYDTAIQMLMLEFLSRFEKLLPIPDLEQTASLLNAVPSALEKCLQFVPDPIQLRTLLQYHRKHGHLDFIETPSSFGDYILSSLSLPLHVRVVTATEVDSQSEYLARVEGKGLVEGTMEKNGRLLAPDEDQRDAFTEKEHAMNRKPVSGAMDNQAVTGIHVQTSKQSKRLQIKKIWSKVQKTCKTDSSGHAIQQPSSSKVHTSLRKSCKRGPFSKTCPDCGRTFARATSFRRHQRSHTQDHDHRFKCLKCAIGFKDLYDLKRHQQGVCEKNLSTLVDGENKEEIPQPSTTKSPNTSPLKTLSPSGLTQKRALDTKTCSLCRRFFTRTSDMARHMRSHSKEHPFWCVNCDKRFKYSYDLKRHQRDLCKKVNQEYLGQVGQNLSQQNGKPQPEKDESESMGSTGSIGADENPQPSHKGLSDSKTCCVCGRILTRTSDMERHLKSHSKARPFHCAICERSFKYKDTLKKHQEILGHEGILEDLGQSVDQQQAEVKTEGCSSPLTTKENDTEPLITATTSVLTLKEPKPCTVCGKIFNRASGMAIHMRSHSEERPYQCGNCEQRFKYMHGLKKHQRDICLKVNQEEASKLVDQQQEDATPEEAGELLATDDTRAECKEEERKVVFKCDECDKEFKGSSSLRTHKRIHNPFYCSDCGRIYPNSIAFDRHKLMHKEIQCTMCEKTFTLLGRLREHYLHQHKFTGPYPCSQCEKTFTQLSYLVIHERVHSGEYLYQCSVCPEKFSLVTDTFTKMKGHG